jgi:hypothetical protein
MVQAREGAVEAAGAKSTQPSVMETAAVKSAPVEAAKCAPTEPAGVKSAPVNPPAAVGRSISEVWLAECSSAQQCSYDDCPSPSSSGPGSIFF